MSAINFYSPSMRASSSDLAIAISPLGLVELSDEEFEMHGPRLNRYAEYWAWYLGHHWGVRKEFGDVQLTFNYIRAFSDYINNFCFSRGISFNVAREYEHITPALLKRIWQNDNNMKTVLWEMGQQGGISGDAFIKVAYEPTWTDDAGTVHEGRVRILPLNSAFCFPTWHPHDRDRLLEFKLKYRFWGTNTEGTRSVYTYTELIRSDIIREYVNDELIDERPNVLGEIPIVHIPNAPASGSPWGLSDVQDIISLNRQYNETATDIVDIVNYHAAPITVVIGAKPSQLEKGTNRVWSIGNKEVKVENLESNVDLQYSIEVLNMMKTAMHEMTGVPESALGQSQPISNTSGVALSIQFQPLMQKFELKQLQYGKGLKKINELALRTLFIFEPATTLYNPLTEGIQMQGQVDFVNPSDPLAYVTDIDWPSPLPVDKLIKLNEIQAMMAMNLESRRGALKDLGEQFPDEKLREIFDELTEDAKRDGALRMIQAQIDSAIQELTGLLPQPDGTMVPPPPPGTDAEGNPLPTSGGPNSVSLTGDVRQLDGIGAQQAMQDIVAQAYGTKLGTRQIPTDDDN
ncbi:portal protein [Streptomyces phage BRock]|uniref:Portal protein n=1 Tax=Streptomyces phage BRock TaxID=1913591 RepID=A0A1J0GW65_9CAUD|nr:portal protein [Streptomyces phage BRock]APC46411.1 portal protein [Streptomyces phage BRock]